MAIQFLRGNKSTLEASQQIFLPGQPIYEQDSGQLKIGNGSDIYSALKYVGASSSGGSDIVVHGVVTSDYWWRYDEVYFDLANNLRVSILHTQRVDESGTRDTGTDEYKINFNFNRFQTLKSQIVAVIPVLADTSSNNAQLYLTGLDLYSTMFTIGVGSKTLSVSQISDLAFSFDIYAISCDSITAA